MNANESTILRRWAIPAVLFLVPVLLAGCSASSGDGVAFLGSPFSLDEFEVVLPTSFGSLEREVTVEISEGVGATGVYMEVLNSGSRTVRFALEISAENEQIDPIHISFFVASGESQWIALNYDTHPEFFLGRYYWSNDQHWTGMITIKMSEDLSQPLNIRGMVTGSTYDDGYPY